MSKPKRVRKPKNSVSRQPHWFRFRLPSPTETEPKFFGYRTGLITNDNGFFIINFVIIIIIINITAILFAFVFSQ